MKSAITNTIESLLEVVISLKYLESLRSNHEIIQSKIEVILESHKSQPVGSGYIDIISSLKFIEDLIIDLTNLGVAINGVTWWCLCSEDNMKRYGCPHGLGGPKSAFSDGWFSEMGIDYESFDISQETYDQFEYGKVWHKEIKSLNESVNNYIFEFLKDDRCCECFMPSIWLHVPREWKRLRYMK
jgi:hypothetical protein